MAGPERTAAGLHVATVLSPAPGKGHDRLLLAEHFVGVADGATPLQPDWPQDVGDFAEAALQELATASGDLERPVTEVWRVAMGATRARGEFAEPFHSCGVAMARLVGDQLQLAALGDCGLLLRRRSRPAVEQYQDDALASLDAVAREAADASTEVLLQNRLRMNTPGGYWVFGTNPEAADHVVSTTVPVDDVDALLVYTDGFYRLLSPYGLVPSTQKLLELAVSSLDQALLRLRDHEQDHPDTGLLGRPDDATAVLGTGAGAALGGSSA